MRCRVGRSAQNTEVVLVALNEPARVDLRARQVEQRDRARHEIVRSLELATRVFPTSRVRRDDPLQEGLACCGAGTLELDRRRLARLLCLDLRSANREREDDRKPPGLTLETHDSRASCD